MKNWYSVVAQAGKPVELSIYDDIGAWGVTAKEFVESLNAIDAPEILLSISSAGGSVFDALVMYNALRAHKAKVTVTVMGVAASAASLVAMAGDTIKMPANTFMMVHAPETIACGNADEMRETADLLDKICSSLTSIYCKRTGRPEEEINALLAEDTYMTAAEAVAGGFADEVIDEIAATAHFEADRLPEKVRAALCLAPEKQTQTPPAQDPQASLGRDALASIFAKAVELGVTEHVGAILADATITTQDQALAVLAEAKEIADICAAAKMPEVTARMVAAKVPVATVRKQILDARAALDESIQMKTNPPAPSPSGDGRQIKNFAEVYSARRSK